MSHLPADDGLMASECGHYLFSLKGNQSTMRDEDYLLKILTG